MGKEKILGFDISRDEIFQLRDDTERYGYVEL